MRTHNKEIEAIAMDLLSQIGEKPNYSNNDLMSTLDSYQKTLLKSDFEWMLTNIENNEKQIEYYFEKNKEFSEEASNNSLSYGVAGATPVSTPSSKQRFG